MTIQQDFTLRPHIVRNFTGTGQVGPDSLVTNMTGNLRVVVENVGGGNTILVKGRLEGQTNWVTLDTIVGPSTGVTVDVSVVDQVQFTCTVYSASGGIPNLIASSFFKQATGGGGGGSINDGANVGAGGVGLYDGAVGDTLNFRNINSGSPEITVTYDAPNSEVDIGFNGGAIDVFSLGGMGTFNNSKFTGTNSSGDLESIQAWDRNIFDGVEVTQNLSPTDIGTNTLVLNKKLSTIVPTEDITDTYFQDADYMQVNSAFDLSNFNMKEYFIEYLGSGSIVDARILNLYLNLGQGGTPSSSANSTGLNSSIEVRDDHTANDITWTNANVNIAGDAEINNLTLSNLSATVEGTMNANFNGYIVNAALQTPINGVNLYFSNPSVDGTVGNLNGFYMNGFGTGLVTNFTGLGCNPSFPVTNYQGLQVGYGGATITGGFNGVNMSTNADVDNFNAVNVNYNGNVGSYWNGLSMSGNWSMDALTNVQGVSFNPNITGSAQSATGLNIDMSNIDVYAGVTATLVVQDLTYDASGVGTDGNSISIEYVGGGTAGAEVVNVTGNAIEVEIEDGVSTATQIKAAVDGNVQAAILVTVTISGTAGNAQVIFGPTNLAGGENAGTVQAANLRGDVQIDGDLSFSGALSIGKLEAFASQALVTGGGAPAQVHSIISNMTLADNLTITSADTIGVNTAGLIVIGDNCSISTNFLGISALALPAVAQLGVGTTIDNVNAAAYALALQGGGAGTITDVGLCKTLAIPNGTTTITNLKMFWAQLPFGDPGTNSWGVYAEDVPNNYMEGNLVVGSSDLPTNASVGIEIVSTTKAFLNARMTSAQRDLLTAVSGMQLFNTDLSKLQYYDGAVWVTV